MLTIVVTANSRSDIAPCRWLTADTDNLSFVHAVLDQFAAAAKCVRLFCEQQRQQQYGCSSDDF